MRRRLDAELKRRGLAATVEEARQFVNAGRVLVAGAPAGNPARQVDDSESVSVRAEASRYVGRGGEKLAGAIEAFDLDLTGLRVLDAGASTGGFTDCALQAGAREVVAVDVGHGLIHDRLRRDPRVILMERQNIRLLDPTEIEPFDAVVSDLSFISLTAVMQVLTGCCREGGWLVLLVKPQFESDREQVREARGVIRDPLLWRRAIERVVASAVTNGAHPRGIVASPIRGADGNVEFLLYLRVGPEHVDDPPGAVVQMIENTLAAVASSGSTASGHDR